MPLANFFTEPVDPRSSRASAKTVAASPGRLATALDTRIRQALASGALDPIETRGRTIVDGPIRFLVRIAASLRRKDRARSRSGTEMRNPFLPPEPALTVAPVGDGHIAVLNKYNVLHGHLLLVTRDHEDQHRLLTVADFAALLQCMSELPALAFYNGGPEAGASQPHKHLQLVPMPLSDDPHGTPVGDLMAALAHSERAQRLEALPFRHAVRTLERAIVAGRDAEGAWRCYRSLLEACGVAALAGAAGELQSRPYNLVMTEHWMLVVPRSREHFSGVSVNALGYAGSLFVRSTEGFEAVRRAGPLEVLAAVGERP